MVSERDSRRPSEQGGRGGPWQVTSVSTAFDAAGPGERIESRPAPVRLARRIVTGLFEFWVGLSTGLTGRMGWFPRIQPYVGYGTQAYSRLICRTVLSDSQGRSDRTMRGIRELLTVPAPRTRVALAIDQVRLGTVQVGDSAVYDAVDSSRNQNGEFVLSDRSGYLDLVAEHHLTPGTHQVSYKVQGRPTVTAPLYIVPPEARFGVISDVDDTIMVSQVPTHWKAAWNFLLSDPHNRSSVAGMSVFYNRIHDLDPSAPFFYLSASPWNVEGAIRGFIRDHGFPSGPLLLRDLDPRPKTFVPSIVQHKMEFIHQLMADFPHMRFVLIGDDGQSDPTTFAEVVHRYPGRVLAIGIRQLSPGESGLGIINRTSSQPAPETGVPVFYGTTGVNLMRTMLPYLAANH
ncbi:DUF2183 domain-containing protein [Bifidobacterium sp. W8108]|uniref:App1 family protein n=1 Tax=unclassified Bifidobacterium TaxID=2608897 RepID=UPI0018DBCC90|nr:MULTISPECIES: phosphatase domain-containing protein [unclassified Bifidobacterium]MBH9979182.1 DUF2183 domain-containing protein [Bifidobacterium sp. W8108]MBI0172946.1 DUF2183 domain-containing protein [Bifidobacterium sp. M0307]